MNVKFDSEVKNPGDWAFANRVGYGPSVKFMLPIPPVESPIEQSGDPRIQVLPVHGGGWSWNGDEDNPTLSPSIKTEICVGWTADEPPKPILREIYHGHLENGKWRNA